LPHSDREDASPRGRCNRYVRYCLADRAFRVGTETSVVEKVGSFLEQSALVDRVAAAVAAELEKLLDGGGAEDQTVDLGELAERESAESLVCGAVARAEEVGDLLEAEADTLRSVDNRQTPEDA
jgi:hypothetical protein